MGELNCVSRAVGGCSDSIVAGLVVGHIEKPNGERSVVVDAGDAQLRVFSSRTASWPGEGTHVFIRLMWSDETPCQSRWTYNEDQQVRITLCTMDDVRHNGDLTVFSAPDTIPIGTVLALDNMADNKAEPLRSCLREMLVISPSPTSDIGRPA